MEGSGNYGTNFIGPLPNDMIDETCDLNVPPKSLYDGEGYLV